MQRQQLLGILEENWKKYYGLPIEKIANDLGLNFDLIGGKASTVTVVNQLLRECNIKQDEQVDGRSIAFKTVRLKANGVPKESMSFEQIDFIRVHSENWENSFLKRKFESTLFCFIVFQIIDNTLYFKGFKLWEMPIGALENDLFAFWSNLKKTLDTGVRIEQVTRGSKSINVNNLPNSKENKILHVRPKAKDSNDTTLLPDGQMITKQSYWFNASYIAEILKDMSNIMSIEKKKNITDEAVNLKIDWKGILTKDIYTIDQIVNIGKRENPDFNEKCIKNSDLKEHGYTIQNVFIKKESIPTVEKYLENRIFENSYFDSSIDLIYQTPLAKRKIDNLQNSYELLQVEESIFLTKKGMQKAKVTKKDIISYKNAVEEYVSEEDLFTLASLRDSGFYHEVDDYGFDDIFYHNILQRPGRLRSCKFGGILFFAKTKYKILVSEILDVILKGRESMSISEMVEEITNSFKCDVSEDSLKSAILNADTDLYYSMELNRLFSTKEMYLDYIN